MILLFLYLIYLISSIISCPLKTVDINSGCFCGIEVDGKNYIHCQPYSIKSIPEFTRSYIYDKLNVSFNLIEHLTNVSFNHLKVKRLFINNNPIKYIDKYTFQHNSVYYLEELYLNTINNINLEFICYGLWKKLRILKLSAFNINQYQYCFDKLYRLEILIIENSKFNLISNHMYRLPNLNELKLTNNHIDFIYFEQSDLFPISTIRILNLTSNRIRTIPNDLYEYMPSLITLDLSNNSIETIPLFNNQQIPLYINLSFNLINSINLKENHHFMDLSFNPICTIENIDYITNVKMYNLTRLHCDCRLGYFFRNHTLKYDEYSFLNETICSTPLQYQGIYLKDIKYEQLMKSCSIDLPQNCVEVTYFKQILSENLIETMERLNDESDQMSSIRLISFYTLYENNDLLIFWDFDSNSLLNYPIKTKFQIIIEQDSSYKNEIIHQSDFISPYLKQYIIPNVLLNKNSYVCLLFRRMSTGTDKYCREILPFTNQTSLHTVFINRSIVFGFLIGSILTTCLLVLLTFICHLHYKSKHEHSFYDTYGQHRQRYMYIDRSNDDGTYSHVFVPSPIINCHQFKRKLRQPYFTIKSTWYDKRTKQLPPIPGSPCCLLQYHDNTLSSTSTTDRLTRFSSEYSNPTDKEQITSTSIISNTSLDEQQNLQEENLQSPNKHVYEELNDSQCFL